MNIPSAKDFNAEGHWYTSFPSLNHWTEDFGHEEYKEALEKSHGPKHLYVHIPFCAKLCHYCICNIVITNERPKIQFFLDHLLKEIDNLREFYGSRIPYIEEIHLGGGTPNHLDRDQIGQLCDRLSSLCKLHILREFAMEVDPRLLKEGDLEYYRSLGVTRVSFGIQDFDPEVQKAINRVQPFEMVKEAMKVRRQFIGVNFDLLYGLPKQTLETVKDTVDKTLELLPDRITLLKYCHAPEVRRHMKLINVSDLPQGEDLPRMFVYIAQRLMDEGYVWVGLDHFARPHDSLAKAAKDGNLVRTFNGFKPGPVKDMIGLGPTSTSSLEGVYAQAYYDLNRYYSAVNQKKFPIERGYKLTEDDKWRREAIFSLLCADVVPEARLLMRNVCKVFDNKDVLPEHMKIAQKTITRRAVA